MSAQDESDAFESAVARLPYPVFVVDGQSRLRAMNGHARQLAKEQRLHESLVEHSPLHPVSQTIARLRRGAGEEDEATVLTLHDARYEVIHSTRSPKGEERWLMLMLRPFPRAAAIDSDAMRGRWGLTPREAEIAAACVAGRSTAEICEGLSISRETFKTHMARVLSKAECENRSQLISKYLFDA